MNKNTIWILAVILLILPFITLNQSKKIAPSCGIWRIASYWAGSGISQEAYNTYNLFHHFNIEPIIGGYISEVNGMSKSETIAEINEIHSHGDLVVATIGGWGYGSEFNSATNTESKRQIFAEQIAQRVVEYGYDGSVIDWEDGVNNDNLYDLMIRIRTELDKYDTSLFSNIDVCCDVTSSNVARIAPYVNSINTMDYGSPISNAYNEYISAGVPASKLIGGIEFGNWANSASRVTQAAQFILDNNMKGIETWELSGLTSSYAQAIQSVLGTGPAICSGTCTNDCSSGQTRCNGNYKQTCGNYDADSCLEYPSSTSGSGNELCANGCSGGQCISCFCTSWTNGNCGTGGCSSTQRQQTRICTPTNCLSQSQCVNDASCTCTPNWQCTSWSPSTCPSSCTQTRTCTDSNSCGTTAGKPAESQLCTGGSCSSSICPTTICDDGIISYNEILSITSKWLGG